MPTKKVSRKVKSKKVEIADKNIRFSGKSHQLLSDFCRKKGYKLGSFCEIAALNKMSGEIGAEQ